MKIVLFILTLDQVGGAECAIWRLARGLAACDHRVTLVTTQALSQWRARRWQVIEQRDGVRIVRIPTWQRSAFTRRVMLSVGLWITLRDHDLLHARGWSVDTVIAAQIARSRGMVSIGTPMASGVNALYGFDHAAALTPASADELIALGFPRERITIIPNGVELTSFTPLTRPPEPNSVIYVGQFRREKRIELLLHAWVIVQTRYPDSVLTLVGGIERAPHYRQMSAELGVRVTFTSILPPAGVRDQLRRHGLIVQPGIAEGMSNALLEGMACGLAPIAADTPANRALITQGVDGWLYPPNDASALAGAILYLFTHEVERIRLAQNARARITRDHSMARVIDQHCALYQTLLL